MVFAVNGNVCMGVTLNQIKPYANGKRQRQYPDKFIVELEQETLHQDLPKLS